MLFTLEIHTDNEAFNDSLELSRILRAISDDMEGRTQTQTAARAVYDINGNKVGAYKCS
jgi:hypothetical protein